MGTSCLQHAPHPARQEMRRPAFASRSMAWSSNCRLNSNSEGNSSRSVIGRYGTATAKRSEEHTSELQSLMRNSYAVFCLKTKIDTGVSTQGNKKQDKESTVHSQGNG